MNRITANQLIIEILIRVVAGEPADKAAAHELAGKLDEATLRGLKVVADEASILAENVFFEKRREKRAKKESSKRLELRTRGVIPEACDGAPRRPILQRSYAQRRTNTGIPD